MTKKIFESADRVEIYDTRFYTSDHQQFVPSVTVLLSLLPNPTLDNWKENTPKEERDKKTKAGTTRGTNVHEGLEDVLRGTEISYNQFSLEEWHMILKGVNLLKRWNIHPLEATNKRPHGIEMFICSHELGYGGTADLVCTASIPDHATGETKKHYWLLDWKTNNYPDELKWGIQLVAYRDAIEKEYGINIERCGIIHLNAKTRRETDTQGKGWKLYEAPRDQWDEYRKLFRVCLYLWDVFTPFTPHEYEIPKTLSL